jgi:osmotically-inducible protein OsmY
MSSYPRKVGILSSAFILTAILAGCATYGKCGIGGCDSDAKVTANVRTLIDQQPQLGAPNSIQVQTVDRVVYLNGLVSEGLQSREAESVALRAPGVTRVVNLISVTR